MSWIHLQADTKPYRPGTTMRTGKPWAKGSGSPFIPRASIESRPSMTSSTGLPMVIPSTERATSWWAGPPFDGGLTPHWRRRSARRTPIHRALPTYGPPTSFETQASVMFRSISGMRSSCANDTFASRVTPLPWIRSRHEFASTLGTTSAVSTR